MRQVQHAAQPLRRGALRHVLQRDVGGDVADPHVAVRQHHAGALDAGQFRQHLGVAGVVVAGLVQCLLVQRRGDDAADPARHRQPHAALHRLEREAAAVGRELAGPDRLALRPRLQGRQGGPARSASVHRGDAQVGANCARAACSAASLPITSRRRFAGLDPGAQPGGGLDDDLGADAGRVAHGDRKVAGGHGAVLSSSMGEAGFCSRSRNRVGWPKAPDLDTTVTPSQAPPRRMDTGTPGSRRPRTTRLAAPRAMHRPRRVSPPAASSVPGGGRSRTSRLQRRADALRRLGARQARGQVQAGQRPALRLQPPGDRHGLCRPAVPQPHPVRAAGSELPGGHGLVGAEQAEDRQRQGGPGLGRRADQPAPGPARRCPSKAPGRERQGRGRRPGAGRHPFPRRTR